LRKALQKASGYRVAISPIIGTNAVSGPTSAFLKAWGHEVSPLAIVELFHDVLDAFMIHETDQDYFDPIQGMGITPILEDIYIRTKTDASRLFERIMDSK
jgi:LPPG:FO 2-phospho-L-lactate transferase